MDVNYNLPNTNGINKILQSNRLEDFLFLFGRSGAAVGLSTHTYSTRKTRLRLILTAIP